MTSTSTRLFGFVGAELGDWIIQSNDAVKGEGLPDAARLMVCVTNKLLDANHAWRLQGMTSHDRYVTRDEKDVLIKSQPQLGRSQCRHAAFIALRKNADWWAMAQDERRDIIEGESRHIAIGMRYLPAIARRLYHCRDLGESQPFDFLTWFEYSNQDRAVFDELLLALRESAEWQFVEREVDMRLIKAAVS